MGNKKDDYEAHPSEAWSFPGAVLPTEVEWTEERGGVLYYFFRDEKGDLFYQTDSGMRFAAEMDAIQDKKKRR